MLIRQLIVAALAASACAAHADVIPSAGSAGTTAQPGFLSGWTGANGADVMSSGVLSGSLSLIGGISYGDASKASGSQGSATLADVLYGKASASIGQGANGQTTLFYKQGIEGMYLLGSGHGILAAMLGTGVSVVGSSDGVIVSQGQQGSGMSMGSGSGSGSTSTGSTGSTGSGTTSSGTGTGGTTSSGTGGSDSLAGTVNPAPAAIPPIGEQLPPPTGTGTGGNNGGGTADGGIAQPGQGQGQLPDALDPGTSIPEPSSIALMLAGLLGAGGMVRRRQR